MFSSDGWIVWWVQSFTLLNWCQKLHQSRFVKKKLFYLVKHTNTWQNPTLNTTNVKTTIKSTKSITKLKWNWLKTVSLVSLLSLALVIGSLVVVKLNNQWISDFLKKFKLTKSKTIKICVPKVCFCKAVLTADALVADVTKWLWTFSIQKSKRKPRTYLNFMEESWIGMSYILTKFWTIWECKVFKSGLVVQSVERRRRAERHRFKPWSTYLISTVFTLSSIKDHGL